MAQCGKQLVMTYTVKKDWFGTITRKGGGSVEKEDLRRNYIYK